MNISSLMLNSKHRFKVCGELTETMLENKMTAERGMYLK